MFSNVLFWDIAPYVTLAVLIVGTWWRYRYDKFGWTSRSSQSYESRLLRIGSPIFHFGILAVFAGHVMGLLIPPRVTHWLHVSDYAYHLQAVIAGSIAGAAALAGIGLLIYRRFTRPAVSAATTRGDKVMYVVLVLAIVVGLYCDLIGTGPHGGEFHYRYTVGLWFRRIWLLQPHGEVMINAPWDYQLHALIGMVLFTLWPFTRLVHAFSAPIAYLFRPYIVYRSRAVAANGEMVGAAAPRKGW
ncbi:respiratory nitrate reductase subunit gamma [Mycobacterium helveticum]|uniref:Nitrate reductase-like protein NarX n=1 Tax=Mycobacterium helveticum TaxID=2592811 RepID=A0A557XRX3_9MYCO|nr:respiratory nitrate reductase subunit gamma [Mycobacterium helveticum]TVS85321.1 respiratory nitrate reductase subunit gamma [Mycobacterium helveticum]TVS88675.1 respiratory nitrate reductase subunit gamma [Mycobacterium helveticum]